MVLGLCDSAGRDTLEVLGRQTVVLSRLMAAGRTGSARLSGFEVEWYPPLTERHRIGHLMRIAAGVWVVAEPACSTLGFGADMEEVKVPLSVAKAGGVRRFRVLKRLDFVTLEAKRIRVLGERRVTLRWVGSRQKPGVLATVRLVTGNAVVVSHWSVRVGMCGQSIGNVGDGPSL